MKQVMLILAREYRQRVRRPSFWVFSLLVPLAVTLLYALPVIADRSGKEVQEVLLVDETGLFDGGLRTLPQLRIRTMPTLEYARRTFDTCQAVAILHIPLLQTSLPRDAYLYHRSATPPPLLESLVDSQLQLLLHTAIAEDVYGLDPSVWHSVAGAHIRLHARDAATGRDSLVKVKSVVATLLVALMVLVLILFCHQVLRAVREEKQSRIVEVVATTVAPLRLLSAKVVALSLVALSQLLLWSALSGGGIALVRSCNAERFAAADRYLAGDALASRGADATMQYDTPTFIPDEALQGLASLDLTTIVVLFVVFFVLGYLLYGLLLAAVGVRLHPDADALQYTLLLALPLLALLPLTPWLLLHPDGWIATLLTLLPFTSPGAVMLRLPFGMPIGEVVGGAVLTLVVLVPMALWAARSYRKHLI